MQFEYNHLYTHSLTEIAYILVLQWWLQGMLLQWQGFLFNLSFISYLFLFLAIFFPALPSQSVFVLCWRCTTGLINFIRRRRLVLLLVWKSQAGMETGILHISWSEVENDLLSLAAWLLSSVLSHWLPSKGKKKRSEIWQGLFDLKKSFLERCLYIFCVFGQTMHSSVSTLGFIGLALIKCSSLVLLLDPTQRQTQHYWWRLFRSQFVFFSFSSASNCSFITRERETAGAG